MSPDFFSGSDSVTIILSVAILGFLGQIGAVVVAAFLNNRNARLAKQEAGKLALATIAAQKTAADAQVEAARAARELVEAAKSTDKRLQHISQMGEATHKIVNNQRTVLLRMIVTLTKRIMVENQDDIDAKLAYLQAQEDLRISIENNVQSQNLLDADIDHF